MDFRQLGKSDIHISPIVMGTWQAGKQMWSGIEDADTIAAIRAAFDEGITTVDTAEVYGNGYSERIVHKALGDVRGEAVYATKVYANHLAYDQVFEACHRSLRSLHTDYIDLYQIHWPAGSFGTPEVPVEETMRALNELKKQGKIRAIGVSNFSREQLEEAALFGQIDSLQPPYSLFWRHVEKDAMPYCVDNQITILAYSSLAQGLLTGKFGPDFQLGKGDHRVKNRLFQGETFERVQQALAELRDICRRLNLPMNQVALAWLIRQPRTCAIAGARNAEQSRMNARAAGVNLSESDLEMIAAAGRLVTDHLDDDPVMWKW
jgi:aryl-alcohol dehydrogenase-like predicted oxidoreductase